jgi:hypothetical protein
MLIYRNYAVAGIIYKIQPAINLIAAEVRIIVI